MPWIRRFRSDDSAPLRTIFRRAVLEGAAAHYTPAQLHAWADAPNAAGPCWEDRLGQHITVVADSPDGPTGFMTLGRDGYLDLAFVLPEATGTGVADALHDRILAEAAQLGLTRLSTEASLRAEGFFTRMGWTLLHRQDVEISGMRLRNALMAKRLG